MGAEHLPFGSASYFQLDNYGPFILTICAWMEFLETILHTYFGLFGFWALHNVAFRKEQVRGTASVPIFR
jgi:hypothetical protein